MNTLQQPPILDPNNPQSIQIHQHHVLTAFKSLFNLIDQALTDSVPKAKAIFSLLEGPVDLSIHAGLTRYLCKRFLDSQNVPTAEEESTDFEIERIPNCGLCINQGLSQVRILKATAGGIPKATSDARRRFYSSNQYLLPFATTNKTSQEPGLPLSLVVLWSLDGEYSYQGIEIACPRMEREDGSVDCFWIAPWKIEEGKSLRPGPSKLEQDLDEIRPLAKLKKATS